MVSYIPEKNIVKLNERLGRNLEGVVFSYAESVKDIEDSALFRGFYYINKGFKSGQYNGLNLKLHYFIPGSKTIVAKEKNNLIGTITIVPDSELGLPIEEDNKKSIDRKCKSGLYEVKGFVVDMQERKNFLLSFKLMSLIYKWGVSHNVEKFIASTNQSHSRIYKDFWGFEKIPGSHKDNGTEFISIALDMNNLNNIFNRFLRKNNLEHIYKIKPFEEPIVNNGRINLLEPEEIKYFLEDRTSIWKETPEDKKEIFRKMYSQRGIELNLP